MGSGRILISLSLCSNKNHHRDLQKVITSKVFTSVLISVRHHYWMWSARRRKFFSQMYFQSVFYFNFPLSPEFRRSLKTMRMTWPLAPKVKDLRRRRLLRMMIWKGRRRAGRPCRRMSANQCVPRTLKFLPRVLLMYVIN